VSRSLDKAWGAVAGCHHYRTCFAERPSSGRAGTATDREAATVLLAALAERSYNTEIALPGLANTAMDKFEEFGKRIDEELTRLRRYIEQEVAPETERRSAEFLREVSEKLNEAASKLEARMAARRNPPPPTQQS
jgi:hypothetical protein